MKKITLFLGLPLIALLIIDYSGLVGKKYCSYTCLQNFDGIGFHWLVLFFMSFTISLALSFSSEYIFLKWWKFARITIPVILVISTVIGMQLHHNSYGFFNMDNMFDIPALMLMYGIFVIGSVIQIWRGYKEA